MCALVSLLGSNAVFAADPESTWKTLGFQISGGVSASYNHNFNNPNTNLSQLRTHDANTNTFTPNLAQVVLARPAVASGNAADRVGFKARLNFGPDARVSRARTNYLPGTDNNELDFQELYAEYIAPVGNGLLIQMGKINTALGNETFTSWENPNFTRTFNYNLAQAFTTTGVRLTYVVNPMVTLLLAGSNGWDNVEDNNRGKMVEGALTLTLHPRFVNYFYASYAPEQSNGRGGVATGFPPAGSFTAGGVCAPGTTGCDPTATRLVFDYIMTAKLTDNDTFILEAMYWNESNASVSKAALGQSPNARVNSVIGYLLHNFNDQWALNSRAELFEDAGGARTCSGLVLQNAGNNTCATSLAVGTPQTIQSYTFTLQYKPAPSLITRTEFRHDISNKDAFLYGQRAVDNQSTLAFNVVYLF
jgi:hypothetical protein